MLRSQKLESLGVLAGGIAHDFNNLLTPIVGNAGLLLADLPEGVPARRWATAIQAAGHRATALTTQMLTYAGQTGRQVAMMDVSAVIEDVSLLLETTASSASRVHYDLARDLPPVHGDAAQITQVVMNLVANASDALGQDGGRIDIRTYALDADRKFLEGCYLGENRREGAFVALEVIDDGPGLEPEVRERICDPFFTTKFTGRGLGLAVVLGAVEAHEGALQIESEPGRGTCFRILLPALRGEAASDREFSVSDAELESRPFARSTLLVVDDDEGARELTITLLSRAGFDVLAAASGPEAIGLYRSRGHEIAAVLLDGTMPGMSGAHVFDTLRQLDPEARVLLVSGYARDQAADPLLQRGLSGFLHKPYDPDELLRAVRQLLEPG
jgi:CheY-like chemotaxis protein